MTTRFHAYRQPSLITPSEDAFCERIFISSENNIDDTQGHPNKSFWPSSGKPKWPLSPDSCTNILSTVLVGFHRPHLRNESFLKHWNRFVLQMRLKVNQLPRQSLQTFVESLLRTLQLLTRPACFLACLENCVTQSTIIYVLLSPIVYAMRQSIVVLVLQLRPPPFQQTLDYQICVNRATIALPAVCGPSFWLFRRPSFRKLRVKTTATVWWLCSPICINVFIILAVFLSSTITCLNPHSLQLYFLVQIYSKFAQHLSALAPTLVANCWFHHFLPGYIFVFLRFFFCFFMQSFWVLFA